MGSRVGGSNSIPETVLAQEGARQNVLNPKPYTLNPLLFLLGWWWWCWWERGGGGPEHPPQDLGPSDRKWFLMKLVFDETGFLMKLVF